MQIWNWNYLYYQEIITNGTNIQNSRFGILQYFGGKVTPMITTNHSVSNIKADPGAIMNFCNSDMYIIDSEGNETSNESSSELIFNHVCGSHGVHYLWC